uniref:Transglutaminase N-terminal domain-containing protein n=1 Tax=Amphiprion ocellaris TaxID=80972 RepID=A0A3Q1CYW5_AMPOC
MFVCFFSLFKSVFGGVDFHSVDNNKEHHTDEVSQERLVVRRGQNFKMTLTLMQSFNPELQQLVLTAKTGHCHQYSSIVFVTYIIIPHSKLDRYIDR